MKRSGIRDSFLDATAIIRPIALAFFISFAPNALGADASELVLKLDEIRAQYRIPAYGFALVDGDETLIAGARGTADLASGRLADANTVFRIGSITKAFTALAVLIAVDRGILDLDAALVDLIGRDFYANPWAPSHPVRLVHLLEQTAGFADLSMEEMHHSDPSPLALETALRLNPQNRRVLWRPGTHFSYTNAGAGLAAYALEQRIGGTYEAFVKERIFAPLGMYEASLHLDEKTKKLLATGYDTDAETPIAYWHMLFRAFGAINATPRDMAAFVKLLIQRGTYHGQTLLPARLIERMESPETTLAARSGLRFGYGLGIYAWYRDGALFHGHGGDGDGYLAHFGYNHDTARGYFVVINAFKHPPLRDMRKAIERFIVRELRPVHAPRPRSHNRTTAIHGTYKRVTFRFPPRPGREPERMEIVLDEGRLYTRLPDEQRRELIPVNDQHFRRAGEPEATIAILGDSDGRIVYQGERHNYVRVASNDVD